jgi:DNA repair photolyase
MAGDTAVLMADGRTRQLADLRPGDAIYGTVARGAHRRQVRTLVLDHWSSVKPAYRVTLSDGTELLASADHRFLSQRGWKHVIGAPYGRRRRPHLTTNDHLLTVGGLASTPVEDAQRAERHLCASIAGDTTSAVVFQTPAPPERAIESRTALPVVAIEPLGRALRLFDITTGTGDFVANGVISHNCYARPSHEYLGFGAGTDFDRRILVKPKAPELLRETFDKRSWRGELILFSGNTDCYQPLEASYQLTRRCLEVCAEYRNPVGVITKAALIERDIDLLQRLSDSARVGVTITVPFWNREHARIIEPYAPSPSRRMQTVRRLSDAGIVVNVNVAPVIPGLNDRDIPAVLEAAAEAGARSAAMIMLRLPGPVKQVFVERLKAALPLSADKVLARTREMRGGALDEPRFGARMRGEGPYAEAIQRLFDTTAERLGLAHSALEDEEPTPFRRPAQGQLGLFD